MTLWIALFACSTDAPAPDAAPTVREAPELDEHQLSCLGAADCTLVPLDCCGGVRPVAVNNSSAEAVRGKVNPPDCSNVDCERQVEYSVSCEATRCVVVDPK